MIDADGQAIVRKVIEAALKGDLAAARLVLERLVPPARERPISAALAVDTKSADGINRASEAILTAACAGDLLPSEATSLASIVELRRRAHETQELEQRILALEQGQQKQK